MEKPRNITSSKPSPAIFKKLMDQRRLTLGGISTNSTNHSATPKLSNGGGRKRHSLSAMGVRETDEMMSKLKRENFDLRLNFAKKQEILQKKADKVDHFEGVIRDLKDQIEVLQRALDERDEALSYAAGLVMEKDQEIDVLLGQLSFSRCNKLDKLQRASKLTELIQQPSPLSQEEQESSVFSIYGANEEGTDRRDANDQPSNSKLASQTPVHSKRLEALLSPTTPFLNSPALSVLSESSFQSVYDIGDNEDEIRGHEEDDDLCWSPVSSTRKPFFDRFLAADWSNTGQELKTIQKNPDFTLGRSYRSPLKFGREGTCVSARKHSSMREKRRATDCSGHLEILKDSPIRRRPSARSRISLGLLTPSDTPSKLAPKTRSQTDRSKPLSTKNRNPISNNRGIKTTKDKSACYLKGSGYPSQTRVRDSPSDDKENRSAVVASKGHAVKQAVQRINERADTQVGKRNIKLPSQHDKGHSGRIVTRRKGAHGINPSTQDL